MAPTFVPRYVGPGFYVKQVDISTPNVPQGVFIPAIIGQGSKTLLRTQNLTKGALNGIDGPLAQNIVIDITSLVDQNNVVYVNGVDFKLTRPTPTTASVDWSLLAKLTGTADLSLVNYGPPGDLDGRHLKLTLNGAPQDIVFTAPINAADVVAQINSWVGSVIASLGAGNLLILQANSLSIEEGNANTLLGFVTGEFAAVQEPATGISYTVRYDSDKLASEYTPQLFSNMNTLSSYYGAIRVAQELFSGTALAAAANTLSTGLVLLADELIGRYVKITSGPGAGQVRVIISNTTGGVITVSQDWTVSNPPTISSEFRITDVNDNSITLGAQTSFDAGATFIIGSQYQEDLFDSSNIKLAIDNLATNVSGQRPYCLVLMRGLGATEVSPIVYLRNHCIKYSDLPENKYRMALVGLAQGNDNFTTFTQLAEGTKSRRVAIMDISEIQKDFGDGNGLTNLDGSYVAAGVSGLVCANVDAGEPITRKSLGSVYDVDTFVDPFLVSEKDQMASSGIFIIERRGVDIIVRHALTTDNTDIFTQELKLTRSADFISNYLKSNLENILTGKRLVISPTGQGDVVLLAKSMFVNLLEQLKNPQAQIITKFENPSVTQNETEKRQLDFKANIYLTTDVLWEYAELGFTV